MQNPRAFRDANLRGRYRETTELAARYTRFLDTIAGPPRLEEIRRFRSLSYRGKRKRILELAPAKQE